MARRTLYGTVIVTYRCNARCNMCDCFKDPTRPDEEITLEDIRKLPEMAFTNITGGEPFIRQDIPDIVSVYEKNADLVSIGAYKAGTNPKLDHALKKIDAINQFLMQGVDEAFSYEESLNQLRRIMQ